MLKVLHFTSNAERNPYLCAIADHADRARFDIIMASLTPAGLMQKDISARGLRTFALDCTRRAQYPRALLRLVKWLKRERIDIIQTHLFEASLVGLAAARLAGTPLAVFTGHHSHEVPLHRRRSLLWADGLCSRWLSHYIISPSLQMKEILIRDEGVPSEKIAVIPYGFDLTRWQPRPEAQERIRSDLGLNGKVVLGAVGRLFWVKNYPSLLNAFAAIATKTRDVMLLIVGDGPDREELAQQVRGLSIGDRVIFAGYRNDIVDVLATLDVFVHPSLAESFGQVIVEAFVLGKPVVSTDVGVAREIIDNGVNGFLVRTRDPEALREALEAILQVRDRWEEMGREGQRRVQQFSAEIVVPVYEAQYIAWLNERRKLSGACTP